MNLLQREKSMLVCNKNILATNINSQPRPLSLPSDVVLPMNLFEKCLAAQNIVINAMGDGIEQTIQEPIENALKNGMRKPDLELSNSISPNSVSKDVVKPKYGSFQLYFEDRLYFQINFLGNYLVSALL